MAKQHARGPGKLDIKVTPEIMAEAMRKDSSHCMIAEAIAKHVPWARFISVDLQTIRFSDPGKAERYVYLTPRSCQQHLVDFDQGSPVEAFDFRLSGAHVIRSRAQPEVREKISKERTKRRAKYPKGGGSTPRADNPIPTRATIDPHPNGNSAERIPQRVGGLAPPTMKYAGAGRRREFGLRGLK